MKRMRKRSKARDFIIHLIVAILFAHFTVSPVLALPRGEAVQHGDVQFERNGNVLTIHQGSGKAIINYQGFDIGSSETVQFIQPGNSASALNRVVGGNASEIAGALLANGRIFLINPNGILFSSSARVNVGGLVAAAMNMSNEDFLNGRLFFSGPGGEVVNNGDISAGFAYLIGSSVANNGNLSSGDSLLATGNQSVLIDKVEGGQIRLVIDGEENTAADLTADELTEATQTGAEDGGEAADGASSSAAVGRETGALSGAKPLEIVNTGQINADGIEGGRITIEGGDVTIGGSLTARGTQGGGGRIEVRASENVVVQSDSLISADAGLVGDGGTILLVGENQLDIRSGAEITARGGQESGDGGYVETSGKRTFYLGTVPDVSARHGRGGTWYIDPIDITIQDGSGSTVTNSPVTANTLNDDDMAQFLESSGSLIVETTSVSNEAGNIYWNTNALVSWGTTNSLTLNADGTIDFLGTILATNAAPVAFNAMTGSIHIAGTLFTLGSVSLMATNGAITKSGAGLVGADALTADAGTGIDVNTAVATLDASVTGAGNILVSEADGIDLLAVETADGSITVEAGGAITATDVASLTDADANDISLTTTAGDLTAG